MGARRTPRGMGDPARVMDQFTRRLERALAAHRHELDALRDDLQIAIAEFRASPKLGRLRPLSDDQKQVWDLLAGHIKGSKELSQEIYNDLRHQPAIRKLVQRIRATGRKIVTIGRCGYYRPDSPPDELPNDQKTPGNRPR